ncbi:MAG: type I secretion protein [Rhodobacteraceae bacterium]|nr:type I secretion protein [Paracoccaceae bacterium]
MEEEDFVVYGIDVLDAPSVSTNSGAGNNGQGTVTVSGGTQPFEDDDVIVFSAVRTRDNEIAPGSAISGIVVYDSLEDYQNGVVKYTYEPMNPGQTGTVQPDLSGLGDGYVSFNANVLVSSDGGPSINRLFIAPNTNLADTAQQPGGLTMNRNEDMDLNGDGDTTDPGEAGDNRFYVGDYTATAVCFTPGTLIRTPRGDRPIEDLVIGDRVLTHDNGPQPIRWIGRRRMPARGRFAPVLISAGTFGDHGPLLVSQNHRILRQGAAVQLHFADSEVLVAAKHLVDQRQVTLRPGGTVDYIHLLFDDHQLIRANGLLSESLFPGARIDSQAQAESLNELLAIFPELARMRRDDPLAARRCLTRFEARLLVA